MSARAVASEQLSGQIVDSLTAGLLVVDREGRVEILNPAGARLLGLTGEAARPRLSRRCWRRRRRSSR